VIGFSIVEGRVRDVSEDVARELRQRCVDQGGELPWSRSSSSITPLRRDFVRFGFHAVEDQEAVRSGSARFARLRLANSGD
jgi:hypothetical protein